MRDRYMRSRTELAQEIQLIDWSTAGNLSNRSSGVQIPRDICTRFGRYLYSTKCSWIIRLDIGQAPVVQKLDNAIHRITHYPADSVVCLVNIYALDSDLSGG